jgi:hypothetical protein
MKDWKRFGNTLNMRLTSACTFPRVVSLDKGMSLLSSRPGSIGFLRPFSSCFKIMLCVLCVFDLCQSEDQSKTLSIQILDLQLASVCIDTKQSWFPCSQQWVVPMIVFNLSTYKRPRIKDNTTK